MRACVLTDTACVLLLVPLRCRSSDHAVEVKDGMELILRSALFRSQGAPLVSGLGAAPAVSRTGDPATVPHADEQPRATLIAGPPEVPATVLRALRWRLLPPLWLAFACSMAERSNIAFAELTMRHELGLSAGEYGLVAGIFFVPFALCQLPISHAASFVGRRRALTGFLVVWSVVSASTALAQSASQLVALRFLLGLAESGFFPTALAYISVWFPGKASGQVAAIFMTGAGAGFSLSAANATVILEGMDGMGGLSTPASRRAASANSDRTAISVTDTPAPPEPARRRRPPWPCSPRSGLGSKPNGVAGVDIRIRMFNIQV